MENFIKDLFSPSAVFGNLFWTMVCSLMTRLWFWFISISLDKRKELTFWLLTPLTILVILSTFSYLVSPKSEIPNLSATIDRVNSGLVNTNEGPTTYLTIIASIRNTGAPSIAEKFTLTVHPPKGGLIKGILQFYPDNFVLKYSTDKTEILYGKDALDYKAAEPIPRGGMVRGHLFYLFPKFPLQSIELPGVKLELSFADVLGKNYAVITPEFTGGKESTIVVFPGMERPKLEQPQLSPQSKLK